MTTTEPTQEESRVTDRAQQLQTTANHQISELIDLLSTLDQGALHRPCPSREKLGDGTIGGALLHTADNYQRIARFVEASDRMSTAHQPAAHAGHRIPRFLGRLGHGPEAHRPREHGAGQHADGYTADGIDRDAVAKQLGVTRDTLARIGELTDSQLDQVPPKDSFRFCDGQRTLGEVLASLLKHQAHQLEALRTGT
jgi:hypothetical protein